ncbi:MAG: AAA family ATPase [Nannocystaceae bacterium]|nr:AAA family ATPase [Nannocystaceae bacterium]
MSPADPHAESQPTLRSIVASSLPELAGRDTPLSRLADAVGRSEARPPLLVGAPGSGRTLLACHLASVQSRPVFRLEATAYEDDAALRADLQAIASTEGIAVIDDLDRVVAEVSPVCLPALTHAWSVGCPPVVTVVSPQGRGRLAAWLPGGTDGLDIVEIEPLAGEDLTRAVAGSAPAILTAHGVTLGSDAKLSELVRLADRFLAGLAMPARALDLLDLACARTVRNGATILSRDTWIEIVVERSGLPASRIEGDDDQRLLQLETQLQERVVGHQGALSRLADLVRRNQAGFGSHRPIASVLLLGPSGVGKTEIAKALAEALFDRPDALVRLDMSEYSEPHAVARIVGAPPGYVGFEHGGALVDPLAARPHRVVLLDEIEKAHRDVHQLLLQVFDEGRLTDGRGRTIDFRHAVIILTSNLGADLVADGNEPSEDDVLAAARKAFPVELWNRIEAPLVLKPLSDDALRVVCQRLARASSARLLKERGVQYALSDDACNVLVQRAGNDRSLGARPLRHLLTRDVESMLAEAVLRGRLRAGTSVIVNASNGRLTLG